MKTKSNPHLLSLFRGKKLSPELVLTIAYLAVSLLWILLSDLLAVKIAGNDNDFFQKIQGIKGMLFVLFSGILFFVFSRKLYRGIRNSFQQKESLEEKFLALNEAAREGVYDYDIAGDKATLNDKMKFFFPVSGNRISGFWHSYKRRIHPDDAERMIKEYKGIIKEGKHLWKTEFRLQGRDDKYYMVIGNTYIIREAGSNNPVRLIGAVQDISDFRRLQTENLEQRLKHKRALAASIIRAQETERNRWAGELHDNVCQLLSVANMYAAEIISKPHRAETITPELKTLLMQSISEIRQLSARMKPPSFTGRTLLKSLKDLAANINRVNTIEFRFDTVEFDETRLCAEQKLMMYRIVQEQVNNIIKYAAATHIVITLKIADDEVKISVSDDGKGFDTSEVKTGIGLRNIQSRLQVYNGRMNIKSSLGNGCTLFAYFKVAGQKKKKVISQSRYMSQAMEENAA